MKKVGYIRVSSKDQNLERQLDSMRALGIEEKDIYIDKQSGKDFDRVGYQYMKRGLREGDILHIHSLDRFGRNYNDIIACLLYTSDAADEEDSVDLGGR